MKSGYILISNKQYLPLLKIAVHSLLEFSKKSIRVFSINFDYISPDCRVESIRKNLERESFMNICYMKLSAIIESNFDNGIFLDVDMIATRKADNLFEYHKNVSFFPLFPIHPESKQAGEELLKSDAAKFFGIVKNSQHYVHADPCIFTSSSMPFFQECLYMKDVLYRNGISVLANDEGIINLNLWKHGCTENYIKICAPYYLYYEYKLDISNNYQGEIDGEYCLCHGCKDIKKAEIIWNKLVSQNGIL